MSNRHNYTNYSKPNKPEEKVIPAPQTEDNNQNIQETEPATVTVPDPQTEPTPPAIVTGVVVNCEKLNIRADASTDAEVLCVINKGGEVEIVENVDEEEFYGVIYGKNKEVSVEGFCMKKYIKLN